MQGVGGLVGPVGLFVVDPGQDHGVVVEVLEAAGGQEGLGGAVVGAGEGGGHGAGVGGVGVEADVGVDRVVGHGGGARFGFGPGWWVGRVR
ncbi:hypothetical protein SGFS_021350 [Streptomyces graminofaciens]|uniref:Uncharacterized protein n=1 Tax=Streptomyces graminofaciens TaxID=68212 RepID=A0ABM7F4T5_9ACTN|nr:hypothetical protein SGFS_021350 [Streptomyces graminofaciens]